MRCIVAFAKKHKQNHHRYKKIKGESQQYPCQIRRSELNPEELQPSEQHPVHRKSQRPRTICLNAKESWQMASGSQNTTLIKYKSNCSNKMSRLWRLRKQRGEKKEMSTIKTDTAWPSGIDSSNNSEYAQKNNKVTQKKKTRNHRSSKFYTHTHTQT